MTPTIIQKSEGYAAVRYFGGRYKLYFMGILALTIVSSIVDSIGVLAFFPVFTSLLGQSAESSGGTLGFIHDLAGFMPFDNPIVSASALLIVVFVSKTVLTLLREWFTAIASAKIHYNVK